MFSKISDKISSNMRSINACIMITACIANVSVGATTATTNEWYGGEARVDQYIQRYLQMAANATNDKNSHLSFAEIFAIMIFVVYTIENASLRKMYLECLDAIYATIIQTAAKNKIAIEASSMIGGLVGASYDYYVISAVNNLKFKDQINIMCNAIIKACETQINALHSSDYMNESNESISRVIYMDAQYAVRAITQLIDKCRNLMQNSDNLYQQKYILYFPAIDVHKPSAVVAQNATMLSQLKLDAIRADLLGEYRPSFIMSKL